MLSPIDIAVIILYLTGVVIFGIRIAGKQESTSDYFMGSRELPWWAICFSIVATETSTLTIIGIPAVAYAGTWTFLQLTLGYLVGRSLVGWILLPRYYSGEVGTAYRFLGERFGHRLQSTASATFLVTRLLADGVRLFATAIPVKMIFASLGYDFGYPVIILGIGILTALYTYFGGLKAVVWMDVVQMGLYVFGALITIMIVGMTLELPVAVAMLTEAGKLTVFDLTLDPGRIVTQPYVMVTAVVGGAVFSMASHGTDQLIVQRLLACASLDDARKALVGSAVIVMIQFVAFLTVGSLLWAYYGGATPEAMGLTRADEIFPRFIIEGLPVGLTGLLIAGILAAAMSTLSSSLNALASSSVLDLFGQRLAVWSDAARLQLSRRLTLVWAVVFVGFATLFEDQQNPVVELGLSIASFTYGALLGGFALGLWNRRANEVDAIIAFAMSVSVMVVLIFGIPGIIAAPAVAWPWYTAIGTLVAVGTGSSLALRHS